MNKPKSPKGLSPAARRWWARLQAGYGIVDDGGLAVLAEGAWSIHRAEAAKETVEREGMVLYDRWQQAKPHPCVLIERDARSAALRALKQLGVGDAPGEKRAPGRPAKYKAGISHGE